MSRFERSLRVQVVLVLCLAGALAAWSYTPGPPVSPTITAQPIHVVIWVRNNVSVQDEARTVADIEAGLALWENVATSHIAFDTTVIRSATRPTTALQDLLVIVANQADLTQGGASLPSGGNPGTWFGAVADFPGTNFHLVAAHEIGHAIGFNHTTVGSRAFSENIPIMHWALAGVVGLTDDDVAVVSTMYPSTTTPLESVTGEIRGRITNLGTGLPLNGVNVVAVNPSTGAPSVGRLSGQNQPGSLSGTFRLVGLPPGTYDVRLLDGKSFAGTGVGMLEEQIQADNFTATTLTGFSVVAGGVIDLTDVPVAIQPMTIDRIGVAIDPLPGDLDPNDGMLPQATVGSDYNAFLHLRGGARPVKVVGGTQVPGLTSFVVPSHTLSADPHGEAHLLLTGRSALPGLVSYQFGLRDTHGVEATLEFDLTTFDPCAPNLGSDADGDGVCADGDGSGIGGDLPCSSGQVAGCDDNCPFQPNANQTDTDTDGKGDRCDVVFPPQLIDFESDGAGVPFTTNIVVFPLDEYVGRGVRFSPKVTQQGSLLYTQDVSIDFVNPYPAGFSGRFLVFTGPAITEFHFNPPVTQVSFAFAAPGGNNPPVLVDGFDEHGNQVIGAAIKGTQPWGFLHWDQYSFSPTAPLATLRFDPQNGNAMRLDNLAFRPTNCAIGLDPEGDGVCGGSQSVPPGVPDGTLHVSRDPLSVALDLAWDVTACPAAGYNILYGNLSAVSSLMPTGSECGIGTAGTFHWSSPPPENLWLLIVADNGAGVEGSWGRKSSGSERAQSASGRCGNVFLSNAGGCTAP